MSGRSMRTESAALSSFRMATGTWNLLGHVHEEAPQGGLLVLGAFRALWASFRASKVDSSPW